MAPIGRRSKVKGVQFTIMVVGAYSGTSSLLRLTYDCAIVPRMKGPLVPVGRPLSTHFVTQICCLTRSVIAQKPPTRKKASRLDPSMLVSIVNPIAFMSLKSARVFQSLRKMAFVLLSLSLTPQDLATISIMRPRESRRNYMHPLSPLTLSQIPGNHELSRTTIR